MLRDLLIDALESSGLIGAFRSKPTFEAELLFSTTCVELKKDGDTVTVSAEGTEGPTTIKFCLDRNWLPLHFCVGESDAACDGDDLWERSDLIWVLEQDSKLEKHLSILGFVGAKELNGK